MSFLDPVNTIAVKTIAPGVVDLVFKSDPLLAYLKKNCLRKYEGGPSWQENFQYGMLTNGPYTPGATFDLSQRQIFTGTTVTPRYYHAVVSALIEKLKVEMNGPTAVFDYVDGLLQAAALTLSARLAVDAYKWGSNQGSDRSTSINGLDEALNDGTNAGVYGNTYQTYLTLTRNDANIGDSLNAPMTTPTANVAGSISYTTLETAFNSVVIGTEQPNLIVTTNAGMSYIKNVFQTQQRFESTQLDGGFVGTKFNGVPVIQSQYAPGARTVSAQETANLGLSALSGETIWFLNTKFARFYVSTDPLFGFGFTGFLPAQDSSVVAGRYHYVGNLTYMGPRYSRVLFGITG